MMKKLRQLILYFSCRMCKVSKYFKFERAVHLTQQTIATSAIVK